MSGWEANSAEDHKALGTWSIWTRVRRKYIFMKSGKSSIIRRADNEKRSYVVTLPMHEYSTMQVRFSQWLYEQNIKTLHGDEALSCSVIFSTSEERDMFILTWSGAYAMEG